MQRYLVFPVLLLVLEVVTRNELLNPALFPPPSMVWVALRDATVDGTLPHHLAASAERAAYGFALAAIVGIVLGLIIGWFKVVERYVGSLLEFLRQIPPLGIYPTFVFILGFGLSSKIAIVFWASVWPVLINTVAGTRHVDPLLLKAAESFGISRVRLFRSVILPSAVPYIFSGLRLGVTYSVLVLVGAEMIGASDGLGFYIISSQYSFRIPQMYAGIVVLGVLGATLSMILARVETRLSRWRGR